MNLPVIPEICDYDCPHAAFPPAETAGICRTMSAVQCGKLGELVAKNRPCEWRRRPVSLVPARRQRRRAVRKASRSAPRATAKRDPGDSTSGRGSARRT